MLRFAETLIYVAVELLGQMADKQRLQQCLGYESHHQRRVHSGQLTGFEVGEVLDLSVETLADFIDRRFHLCLQTAASR